ncbi:TP901-1 family phage major tail protein [Azospirillum agricola]|uniref:phage tail tube protein n=1 Tax=Azospirillum agricola TaxID=1720247 RepID=UPI001AE775AC|nr:phage tail tube protein [Azospirillum agricola]MBP2232566.1 TP901-1 family phage major tail protein [Azospirillum agricola]
MATTIEAKSGRQFTFKISDGEAIPTFLTIGGLKDCKVQINGASIDITNVASDGWKEYLPGGGSMELSISGNGIFDSLTTGARKLFAALINREYIEAQLISGHGDSFVGTFVVENYSRNGSVDAAETFDVSIKSSGPISYIPAPTP